MTAPAMLTPQAKPLPATMREMLVMVTRAFAARWHVGRVAKLSPDAQVARYLLALEREPIPAVAWAARQLIDRPGELRDRRNLSFYPDADEVLAISKRWRDPSLVVPVRLVGGPAPAPTGKLVDRKRPCFWCPAERDEYGAIAHATGCIRQTFASEWTRARAMREIGVTVGQILTAEQSERLEALIERLNVTPTAPEAQEPTRE